MLPKKRRIKKAHFEKILLGGSYSTSDFFSLRAIVNSRREKTEKPSAFSVVVSKKVAPKATERNKLRRRSYHALRDLAPKIKNSQKIVIFAKKGAEKLTFNELKAALQAILSKSRLFN